MVKRDVRSDAARNEAARREVLESDASRSLGENLEQADALIKAAYELAGGFAAAQARDDEMPFDPIRAEDLMEGDNFRLATPLGALDIMQWLPGIDADQAYYTLAADAERAVVFGIEINVCSLANLRVMKRASGRPQDLSDLADLDRAHSSGPLC